MKIDSNIPAPISGNRWKDLVKKMNPGDSVLLENIFQSNCFRRAAKYAGYSVVTRNEKGKRRIWLIEKHQD